MKLRNYLSSGLALTLSALILGLTACGGATTTSGSTQSAQPVYAFDSTAITVTGTENFYADVLHQLGGSKLKIYSFLNDPTADPHAYESNSSNARAVADSRLVIENGLGYDSFMDKLLKASPRSDRVVINVQQLAAAKDGANVHLWYDPTVMPRVATAAADALGKLDPANASTYSANLATFTSSLNPVNDE